MEKRLKKIPIEGGIKMNYMNKTKKELVAIIDEISAKNDEISGHLENVNDAEEEAEALKNMAEELKETKSLFVKCEEEKAQLQEAYNDLKKDFQGLKEQEKNRTRQLDMLADDRRVLKEELDALQSRLEACEQHRQINYDLFKSFVDSNAKNILLIDASYSIKYINTTALNYLGINVADDIVNQRIFDFTEYSDSLRLKEKIDKAFLEGEKEKVKKIRFLTPDGNAKKLKIKMQRVRFQDRPSVKMIINE